MDVDGGVELWAALVQVDDGLYRQRSGAFGPIKSEVPALTASVLTLEPQRAAEQHTQSTVCILLSERALCDLAQVDAIVECVPGTLFIIGFPGLFKPLAHTLALLPFDPISAWQTWSARNPIGSRITIPSRSACGPLQAAGIFLYVVDILLAQTSGFDFFCFVTCK